MKLGNILIVVNYILFIASMISTILFRFSNLTYMRISAVVCIVSLMITMFLVALKGER